MESRCNLNKEIIGFDYTSSHGGCGKEKSLTKRGEQRRGTRRILWHLMKAPCVTGTNREQEVRVDFHFSIRLDELRDEKGEEVDFCYF